MPNQFMSPEGDLETTNYFVTEHWLIDQYVGDKLFGWGYNSSGPLGDNTTTTRYVPVTTFAGGTNWKSIAVGQGYGGSIAIKTDGTLWGWGSQSFGNLGTFNFPSASRITPVTTFLGGTDWKQASAENECTAAVKTDGTLWVWGTSTQLGINRTGTNVCTPVTTFSNASIICQFSINHSFSFLKNLGLASNVIPLEKNSQFAKYTFLTPPTPSLQSSMKPALSKHGIMC